MTFAERRRIEMQELSGAVTLPLKRGPGRPKKIKPEPDVNMDAEDDLPIDLTYRGAHTARHGVPVRWLAIVFGITEARVKAKLVDLAPISYGAHNNPLYTVAEAAPYLCNPKFDISEVIANLRDDQLPPEFRLKVWQARGARNRVLEAEGSLWRSELVIAKFGEVLLSIREKLQLIPEQVERMTGITPDQYKLVRGIVDGVQEEMYQTAIQIAENDETPNAFGDEEVVL